MRARSLQRIEQAVSSFLTDTCDIRREVPATGVMGEPLNTLATIYEDVPCRVIRAGTRNDSAYMEVGASESLVETFRIICPARTEFKINDVIIMTSDGATYQVVDVIDRMTDEVFVSTIVKRVRNG